MTLQKEIIVFKDLNKKNLDIFNKSVGDIELLKNSILEKKVNVFVLDNVIKEQSLNELGLQVYRWLIYDQVFEEIRKKTKLFLSPHYHDLMNKGYIKIENFLSSGEIKNIQTKILKIPQANLTKKISCNLPLTIDMRNNSDFQDILKMCQADNNYTENELYLRKISHVKPGEYSEDARQYNFHVDKFYPNFKIWFYPFSVKEQDGPLAFFESSHINTVEKMRWVYNRSLEDKDWSRLHYNIDDYVSMSNSLNLKKEIRCSASANTMFIVDTRMFHRRTPAKIGKLRLSLRAILKRNNIFRKT